MALTNFNDFSLLYTYVIIILIYLYRLTLCMLLDLFCKHFFYFMLFIMNIKIIINHKSNRIDFKNILIK